MNCMICDSSNIDCVDTILSGFLADRIYGKKNGERIPVKLCHCQKCGFAFYDNRLSPEEAGKLYEGYRSEQYQKTRQLYDIWYTPQINKAIGQDKELENRGKYLSGILSEYIPKKIDAALDFGGDKGQFFPFLPAIPHKYVYDISGVKTIDNVIGFSSIEEAKKRPYDFIMCNHTLEHIGNFYEILSQMKALGCADTVFYFEVPFDSPFYHSFAENFRFLINPYFSFATILKHFIHTKKLHAFAPMTEHINYFTPDSFNVMLKKSGFDILHFQTGKIDSGWNITNVLSAICRIKG